ncbi:MAG: PAS domain-containing protein, partial [Lachnospiraceae bacterium]|nr:PAS domain-containing protein [Lachnospiraceae bacterium]
MNRKECIDFRRICDNLTITLFVADADGYVVYVNPAYLERTGLDESSLVGKTIYELQDNNVIRCDIIPKMLKEGKPLNTIGYVIPTNYRGFISGIPVKSDDGHVLYAMTTDWDVHSIVEMESRLRYLKKGEEMPFDNQSLPENKDDEELLYVSELMKEVVSLAKISAVSD